MIKKIERPEWDEYLPAVKTNLNTGFILGDGSKLNKWFDENVEPVNKMFDEAVEVYCQKVEPLGDFIKAESCKKASEFHSHKAYLIGIEPIKKESAEEWRMSEYKELWIEKDTLELKDFGCSDCVAKSHRQLGDAVLVIEKRALDDLQ